MRFEVQLWSRSARLPREMADIQLKHLRKAYGETVILHDVNLRVQDGEFLVVVGPSGSGKTTLLRLIAGLSQASAGEIRIGGTRIDRLRPKDRDIAMVFQDFALYPHMTVLENIRFGMASRGIPKMEAQSRIQETAEQLGLTPLLARKPAELSGGERQRVAMARAIVRRPKVFLLDEPLSNLDIRLRARLRTELAELQARLKTTMVYVTHDQTEAMSLADRIVVMKDGHILQAGPPEHIYARPQNLFVASFLGCPAMNLWPAELHPGELRLQKARMPIPKTARFERLLALSQQAKPSDGVILGLRPEHIALRPAKGQGATEARPQEAIRWPLSAILKAKEPLGNSINWRVETDGGPIWVWNSALQGPELGSAVHLDLDWNHVHLFDRATHQRLPT